MSAKETLKQSFELGFEVFRTYSQERAVRHNRYRHYSQLDRIEMIANNGYIYLSDGRKWNDTNDRERFNPADLQGHRYGICFSWSPSENIAMWMLYGGMDNKGAALELSRSSFLKLGEASSVELGRFVDGKGFVSEKTLDKSSFSFEYYDVIYSDEVTNDRTVKLRHADDAPSIPGDIYSHITEQNSPMLKPYLKKYPWHYEEETRFVVSVHDGVSCIDFPFARVPLAMSSDILRKGIILSPTFVGDRKDYPNSALFGEVDWDLCKGCKKRQSIDASNPASSATH